HLRRRPLRRAAEPRLEAAPRLARFQARPLPFHARRAARGPRRLVARGSRPELPWTLQGPPREGAADRTLAPEHPERPGDGLPFRRGRGPHPARRLRGGEPARLLPRARDPCGADRGRGPEPGAQAGSSWRGRELSPGPGPV